MTLTVALTIVFFFFFLFLMGKFGVWMGLIFSLLTGFLGALLLAITVKINEKKTPDN